MKNSKTKKVSKGSFSIYLGIILLFVAAFIFLIDKQYSMSANKLADVLDSEINIRTIEGRQLVVRDMDAIYPKYFVIYFDNTDDTYIIHSFNYYQTDSQYELEFRNHLDRVVDYNYSDYMIRYVFDNGDGTFDSVKGKLSAIIGTDNYKIYE